MSISSIKFNPPSKTILLTFDVEDWFQVENFKGYIPFSSWPSFNLRVEKNVHLILDLLDSFTFSPKATFFIMGWIAKRLPQLVKEIQRRGHEVASHGMDHHLCTSLTARELDQDLETSRKLLEDLVGDGVHGYRAPSFAVTNDILRHIRDAGYRYDSSYNSFGLHGRYGSIDLGEPLGESQFYSLPRLVSVPGITKRNSREEIGLFYELPISNLSFGSKVFPLGGGGYFRLIPFPLFRQGMKQVLKNQDAFVFYSHPWEFDPEQPRVRQASRGFRFRHYTNLKRTQLKLAALLECFGGVRFVTCSDYLDAAGIIL